ncbi:MAG: hypothetical protein QGG53_07585 [Planctomycetota bacterium]|jgi:hypothetical protein|nr:hypothetical protein [Planctomycetota bacterium]
MKWTKEEDVDTRCSSGFLKQEGKRQSMGHLTKYNLLTISVI